MWVPRCIIAVISMLVLISAPAVVEGTCHCADVCPNYIACLPQVSNYIGCWFISKKCDNATAKKKIKSCDGYCACNFFGCNCDGCEVVPGACGWTRRMEDDKEKEDTCADFDLFTSLSADGKRNLLADKYCNDDEVVREDIYEVLLSFALSKYEGVVLSLVELAGGIDNVLTCDLFNQSYGDVSHLTLCDNKHLMKKGKKQKKTL